MSTIEINNKTYELLSLRENVTIPDCNVANTNKLGKGNGEAKFYIGNESTSLRDFYGENFTINCIVLKSNLLEYLNLVKDEYKFPRQEYRDKNEMPILWNERYSKVSILPTEIYEFTFQEQTQISKPRIYINTSDEIFKLIRELALPGLTFFNIYKIKDLETGDILYYFKLMTTVEEKIVKEIEKNKNVSRNLKNLFLDPNNYRFVDHKNYQPISDENVIDYKIQQRTRGFIEGKNREGIKDLVDSFKSNGFLEVDMIQLKDLGDNNYLVLEGNRRVAALKILQEDYNNGLDIGKLNTEIFKKVPSLIHEKDDESTHQIVMGLKHISGNKKWPAINQAKLIYDYLYPHLHISYYKEEENLCQSLGITKAKLRSSQRAYNLILQYRKSDFGDQFRSEMYYTFAEITKRPSIKKWIGWNDDSYYAENEENINRLFSWLSIVEESEDYNAENEEENDNDIYLTEERGTRDPIITKYREIQDLAKFIDNEKALEAMEDTNSVAQGLLISGHVDEENFKYSIKNLEDSISELLRLKDLISNDDIEKIEKLHKNFKEILPKESLLDILDENTAICFSKGNVTHFDTLKITNYKMFKNFTIEKLNRVNIFAGFNNSGKSSLLEAVYLLTKQNNIGAFFELTKLKNKLSKLNTSYLNNYIDSDIKISGIYNKIDTEVQIKKFEAENIDKKDDYIASYEVIGIIDNEVQKSVTHTYKINPLERRYDKIEILCNSILKSPYFYNKNEIINTHSSNVRLKVYDKVINFISEYIDNSIVDIEFTEDNEIKRFLVNSTSFPSKSVDLTVYGEGLQRIFEIALAFAFCKNGVLLIDELETAIHHSLLVKFTKFIQDLAIEFNVQVFISSHSKECIDAFVNNGVHNEDINAYILKNVDGKIDYRYVKGDKLASLVETMNFDIRGNGNV